jgi:hypothetical protein
MDGLPYDPSPVDVPISLYKEYAEQFYDERPSIDQPFIEPEDQLRESYANPRPQWHMVRADAIPWDDEQWPMSGEMAEFPIGARMPVGMHNPMDDYRLVFDGSHA